MILRLALLVLLGLAATPAGAQDARTSSPSGWDGERALALVRLAQQRRAVALEDTALVNYTAQARAFLYFYLDREDTGERNLIKTDQLALEVLWQSPDQVKQRIVGWRDQRSLPTRIHYHLDHLSVVQENFGDEIRIGDGDEVRGVPHPAAPGSERFYQFSLVDSLTLRLPGAAEPVQVYQVQVRPRDPSRPAFLGSVFIDRRAGDLVRMDFTFTAASYVDEYLDYINISLDNGLWRGRFWLPNEQRVELRRRLPMLDIPAGSVIRANMRVRNYEFNQPLSRSAFLGPTVVAVPEAEREAFEFEEEIFAELREQGLGPGMELGEIRRMAAQLARRQALRRASGLRLRAGAASEVLRFNRAEGLALGLGAGVAPHAGLRLRGSAGYAFGAEHPFGGVEITVERGALSATGSIFGNAPADLGVGPAASGLGNTLAALLAGRDYTDLHFRSGARLELARRFTPVWRGTAGVAVERHRMGGSGAGEGVLGSAFRTRIPIEEGDRLAGHLELDRSVAHGTARTLAGGVRLGLGRHAPLCSPDCGPTRSFVSAEAGVRGGWSSTRRSGTLEWESRVGASAGDPPVQDLYFLGGRGTVPGYDFRSFAGDRFALAHTVASAELHPTWARVRALAAAGWTGATGETRDVLLPLPAAPAGVRASVGLGVGILHDILHVDLHRGLGSGGRWELVVESNRGFWDIL